MVDRTEIVHLLREHFDIDGDAHILDDGAVDVDGHVYLRERSHVTELPVQFNHVSGHAVFSNHHLKSLKGSPRTVGRDFSCSRNQITSLEHGPAQVSGSYICNHNQLTNLVGAPVQAVEMMECSHNLLTSLEGAPQECTESFWCHGNQLTNLKHLPRVHTGYLNFSNNPLESLEGWDYATQAQCILTCNPHLPLLRCLQSDSVDLHAAPWTVTTIMSKYAGQGKAGAIRCAGELIKAGYKENARW